VTSARPRTAVTVRLATEQEWVEVGLLTRTAYAAADLGDEQYLAHVQDATARAAAASLLVAEADGRLVGTVTLAAAGQPYADIAREGEYEFRMLAVDPVAAGRGIATALVEACDGLARAAGARRLVCSVEDKNAAGLGLYARLGFVREPARDWKPGPAVQLLVLAREIGR
jgi:ribosomal protein S18 acetylase RimI-like enzyme